MKSSVWVRRSIAAAVAVFTLSYLVWCCNVLMFASSASNSNAPTGVAAFLPRFLRAPTEAEEKAAVRAELGKGSWNMLHRLAAKYDKEPTPQRKEEITEFFRLIGEFYPCEQCASHFKGMLEEHPIRTDNNRELSIWLCELHNVVNDRLHKPQFPCTLDALKEKYGKCGCFDPPGNSTSAATTQPAGSLRAGAKY